MEGEVADGITQDALLWEGEGWGLGFGVWGLGFGVWGLGFGDCLEEDDVGARFLDCLKGKVREVAGW